MEYGSQTVQIDVGDDVYAVTFTANGEYLVCGGTAGVQVWRLEDSKRVATMNVENVFSLAVSKDGRFIAAGSIFGGVLVWDGTTYEQVFAGKVQGGWPVWSVDFSPDSTRLVSANGHNNTATIWDILARKKVQILDHDRPVGVAKYSSQGDRIATASKGSVRVWDSDERLLLDINVEQRYPPRSLLWINSQLFVKANDSTIRQIDASSGLTVSEWSVPRDDDSCIATSQGQFLAYSTKDNITFWDTSTHTQLGRIPRTSGSRSIAFSPDGQLAIVAHQRRLILQDVCLISELDVRIASAALRVWKNGRLFHAEALLTEALPTSTDTVHHVLASRALVWARLQQWDTALMDAEKSLEIQASTVGYIAKGVALVGRGDTQAGCRACDIASLLFHSNHVAISLLIKAIVLFMAGKHGDAMSRIDDLVAVRSSDPMLYVVQAYMLFLVGNVYMESGNFDRAIQTFEEARAKLGNRRERPPLIIALISGWEFDNLAIVIQQRLCEALFEAGCIKEAGESVLRVVGGESRMSESLKTWVADFVQRCLSVPEKNYNASSATASHNSALHRMTRLLKEWAKLRLTTGSWKDALASTSGFLLPKITIYQVICERLEMTGHLGDAVACFLHMSSELAQEPHHEQADWIQDFKSRCCGKLASFGDHAMNAKMYSLAILQYTTALSLRPATSQNLYYKRSKAHAGKGEWVDALNDANEVMKLDPSSLLGYERKHEALCGIGRHSDAISIFKMMLLKISESSDPEIREQSHRYIRPEKTSETIRLIIHDTIRDSPLVLINTISGRLCNKSEQAAAFELTSAFTRLVSSMTTQIDHTTITEEVEGFYRYATFSHKWEDNEPLFETVIKIVVYDLEASPTHEKLQMFCKIVREAGFNWAWSDTCCINKGDHFVLQEALVRMFKWYERSAMTLIYLRGVPRLALRGALTRNIWNMRAWTLQEYHASKVVRIYTEDWTPYLGLEIYNHKEAPEIISEMEEATRISAQALMALRPGLDDIREKLRLASTRQTTRVEDAAYSLLGIFSMSLPITYGEGDKALGQLLAKLLTSSGDVSILAWTGGSGSFNSCLPSNITVFSHPPSSHIPSAISDTEMETLTAVTRSLSFSTVTSDLYDRLNGLPAPWFVDRRMKLPCLVFKLGQVLVSQNGSERVFRARTDGLGIVEIRTDEDLSHLGSLCLVHPWIEFLLDRQPVGGLPETIIEEDTDEESSVAGPSNMASPTQKTRTARLLGRIGRTFSGRIKPVQDTSPLSPLSASGQATPPTQDTASLLPPSIMSPSKKQLRAHQFIARLWQPFGALLLTATRRNMDEYRRVAAESLITVQVKEITPEALDKLMENVRVLDVL